MNAATAAPGILVVSHGSPRQDANQGFVDMVGRLASRLGGADVLPAFFSIAAPSIEDRVAELAVRGVRRIVLLPYFLYTGQHVRHDIPAQLDECRRRWPGVALELLPTLENDPALEDVLVERLLPLVGSDAQPQSGAEIERRSFEIIDRQIAAHEQFDLGVRAVLRRIVHATADFSFARSLRVHPQAVRSGRAALAAGAAIVCDVRMVQAGLTKVPGEVLCAIDSPEVAAMARAKGCTRAAAAMEFFAGRLSGAIVAVGNAPTALWKILDMARSGVARPALVVGLPVGFVGARESKAALMESDLVYIANIGPRGGSPVAAAAVNALATLPEEQ